MDAKYKNDTLKEDEQSEPLEYLMRRYGDKVLKLAYYHVRDRHQAEDIAQEVFCRVYKNMDKFRQDCSYFTWIYRITVNLCRDHLRSAYFKRILPWGNTRQLYVRPACMPSHGARRALPPNQREGNHKARASSVTTGSEGSRRGELEHSVSEPDTASYVGNLA